MNAVSKTLIPNKEWIITDNKKKLGSLSKKKQGFDFYQKGKKYELKSLDEIKKELGITVLDGGSLTKKSVIPETYVIYDFPCSGKPFEPVYNIRKKLPLFSKSSKSQSLYCAGYYVIKFRKGWVKSFCPKLITLDRYPFYGPYKTEQEMKTVLNSLNKS